MPAKKKTTLSKPKSSISGFDPDLVSDLRDMIISTRQTVARGVNAALVMLYWKVGDRIRRNVLHQKRAAYGSEILPTLSSKLVAEFGRGYSQRNLASMIRLAEVFPDHEILQSLTAKLSWTHFLHLIYLDDPLKRDFYAEMCRVENWNTRTLRDKIDSMLFERTALSKKPAKLAEMEIAKLRSEDQMTPDLVFRDPYILDFLDLEKDGIRVSSYRTEALPKDLLRKKLHQAVVTARANLEARTQEAKDSHINAATKTPKDAPTRKQGQFLAFIREYMMRNEHGVAPTHAAFQKFFNLTPPSVNSMLIRLEQRGFIRRIPGQARGIQLTIAPDLIPPLGRPFKF